MNKISTFALLTPAVLIPFFGSLPGVTMNKFAETCMDFFHGSELEKSVSYFTWTNLKGSLISITIGLILYFGFVRTVLMKRKNGQVVYINRWPEKLDLEELLYRPLILGCLPSIFGWLMGLFGNNVITGPIAKGIMKFAKVLAHALSDLLDAFVLLLRKTIFRESDHMILTDITDSTSFQMGLAMDKLNARLGKEKVGSTENAKAFYEKKETYKEMQRKIQTTLSFALLAFCFTAVLIFAYVMFIY